MPFVKDTLPTLTRGGPSRYIVRQDGDRFAVFFGERIVSRHAFLEGARIKAAALNELVAKSHADVDTGD